MKNWYLKLCGNYATFIGFIDNYSDEHKTFLSSGFKCPHCQQSLMKSYGIADVNCYDKNGKIVPVLLIGLKGKNFECPKCKHLWNLRNSDGLVNIIKFTFIIVILLVFSIYRFFI